jgi:hypothetical protein
MESLGLASIWRSRDFNGMNLDIWCVIHGLPFHGGFFVRFHVIQHNFIDPFPFVSACCIAEIGQ